MVERLKRFGFEGKVEEFKERYENYCEIVMSELTESVHRSDG